MAIKDSSGDLPHMIRMIQAVRPNRPDFAFLTGWDAALMPMLLVGCDDGASQSGDGCASGCQIEGGWSCIGQPSACAANCGDGLIVGSDSVQQFCVFIQ